MTLTSIVLILAGIFTSLIAGLFFAFTCAVNLGLGRLKHAEYLAAMQSINVAILNPLFFISFFGSLMLLLLATFLHAGERESARFLFLLAASTVYLVGQFGVTVFGNIPLNKKLERFEIASASDDETTAMRRSFETQWNRWNGVRTVASIVTVALIFLACLYS